MLDDLIRDMEQKGLVSFISTDDIFGNTEPIETDSHWWALRAHIIAHDHDRMKILGDRKN